MVKFDLLESPSHCRSRLVPKAAGRMYCTQCTSTRPLAAHDSTSCWVLDIIMFPLNLQIHSQHIQRFCYINRDCINTLLLIRSWAEQKSELHNSFTGKIGVLYIYHVPTEPTDPLAIATHSEILQH